MDKPSIGIVGAGRLGTALARGLSGAGYEVAIINSRGVDSLSLQLSILMPGVRAMALPEMTGWADVIILAIPLPRYKEIDPVLLNGKIVIDAMNYWPPVDGKLPEFDAYSGSSSELVARNLPGARVIKTFNSVAYGELEEQALPSGTPNRRAIPLAGDDNEVKNIASMLIDAIGFEPVDLGGLAYGVLFQPDTELFNARLTKSQIINLVHKN